MMMTLTHSDIWPSNDVRFLWRVVICYYGQGSGDRAEPYATPPRQSGRWDWDLMDDLLAWLLATAVSCNMKKNGPVDNSHRKFAQERSWQKMCDEEML